MRWRAPPFVLHYICSCSARSGSELPGRCLVAAATDLLQLALEEVAAPSTPDPRRQASLVSEFHARPFWAGAKRYTGWVQPHFNSERHTELFSIGSTNPYSRPGERAEHVALTPDLFCRREVPPAESNLGYYHRKLRATSASPADSPPVVARSSGDSEDGKGVLRSGSERRGSSRWPSWRLGSARRSLTLKKRSGAATGTRDSLQQQRLRCRT